MSRRAIDPVDRALECYRALTSDQKLMFAKVVRYMMGDPAFALEPPKPEKRRQPRAKETGAVA